MKEALWGYWIFILGILVILVMMLIQSFTTTSTEDYYLMKETAEAAMIDAVDYSYYRQFNEIRINKEKFVENFIRRFAETVNINKTYQIDFYSIYEAPPKASIRITTKSNTFVLVSDGEAFEIINQINAALELKQGIEDYSS